MKNITYIAIAAFLGVFMGMNAQTIKGVVKLADEPVKGAELVADQQVVAKTNAAGEFSLDREIQSVQVNYKKMSKDFTFAALGYAEIVLLPTEEKLLKMIEKNPSLEKCTLFLANYPGSEALSKVKSKQEELTFISAYEKAVTEYEVAGLDAYVAAYPDGAYAHKAIQTMEVISWQYARLQDTPESYNDFLARYPDSKAAKEASDRMANLQGDK